MLYKLTSDEDLTILVDTLGGELKSIKCRGDEILWNGDSEAFPATAPNLFPFVGRLYKGKYTLDGNDYPMGIHGFLSQKEMTVSHIGKDRLTLELTDDEDTYQIYPYLFTLRIEYILEHNTVSVNYTVKNNDYKKVMYFSLGGHPGFLLDFGKTRCFSDYYIEFSKECTPDRFLWDEDGLLKGTVRFEGLEDDRRFYLDKELFRNDAIVLGGTSGVLKISCRYNTKDVSVSYSDFPLVGIWHPYITDDPFICIEPWYGLPGRKETIEKLDSKPYTIKLDPLEEKKLSWAISLENR